MTVKNSYVSCKQATFAMLGTPAEDWCAAKIKGFVMGRKGQEKPVYHIGSIELIPSDHGFYTKLIRDEDSYTHILTQFGKGSAAWNRLQAFQKVCGDGPSASMVPYALCELCGHGIKDEHVLINYKAKLYMIVGCECIHENHKKVILQEKKLFRLSQARREFDEIKPRLLDYLSKQLDLRPEYSVEYKAYVRQNNRLVPWAYQLKKKILKIGPEASHRKLINILFYLRDLDKRISLEVKENDKINA